METLKSLLQRDDTEENIAQKLWSDSDKKKTESLWKI